MKKIAKILKIFIFFAGAGDFSPKTHSWPPKTSHLLYL